MQARALPHSSKRNTRKATTLYGKHRDTASIVNCVEKQLTYKVRHVPPSSPDIILKHALHSKMVHYQNPPFFSINLKSAIQDLLKVL